MENEEKNENMNNKQNEADLNYQGDQANGNIGHPSSKRNIGLGGATQPNNQKDNLQNLHIGGNETTGYSATNSTDAKGNGSGHGFEAEGSEFSNDHPVKEE